MAQGIKINFMQQMFLKIAKTRKPTGYEVGALMLCDDGNGHYLAERINEGGGQHQESPYLKPRAMELWLAGAVWMLEQLNGDK